MTTDRLLLDTHVVIWWRTDPAALGKRAQEAIAVADVVMVSAASAWEAAIKSVLGKLELPESFETGVEESGFGKLSIAFHHAEAAALLPRHHNDPFDRMLVAQARAEGLTLVTHDVAMDPYDVDVLWV